MINEAYLWQKKNISALTQKNEIFQKMIGIKEKISHVKSFTKLKKFAPTSECTLKESRYFGASTKIYISYQKSLRRKKARPKW